MTFSEFKSSLKNNAPPDGVSHLLKALWYEKKNDWDQAHSIAQEIETPEGAWVHAYLHRREGDESNAVYWYSHAGRKFPKISMDEEWDEIVNYFLSKS